MKLGINTNQHWHISSAFGCNITAAPPAKVPIFTETSYWFDNVTSSSVKKVVSITIQQGEERIAIVLLFATKKHHLLFPGSSGFLKCYTQAMQTTH